MQKTLFYLKPPQKDIVYTKDYIAFDIINWIKPKGKCLDPCLGDGAFFKYLPKNSDWCEITKGRDFFDYNKNIDWIIGNPPYSIFEKWLRHSFNISKNVVYIVPTNKIFQRKIIMDMINNYGGINGLRVYGNGKIAGFPFGFSVGAFYFKKKYKGLCDLRLVTEINGGYGSTKRNKPRSLGL